MGNRTPRGSVDKTEVPSFDNETTGMLSVRKIDDFDRQYDIVTELGSGVTAQVFLIRSRKSGKEYAMKMINLNRINIKQIDELRREVVMLKELQHPNVVRLVEVYENPTELKLVMELCRGGSLLNGRKRLRSERSVAFVIYQILLAIEHVHSRGIIHRDIKLENVMFISDKPEILDIQLIDFGFSGEQRKAVFKFKDKRLMKTSCGTSIYMAPEVLDREYDNECDIWSIGVLAYILVTGVAPFKGVTLEDTYALIKSGEVSFDQPIWQKLSKDAELLVRNMLVVDPDKRWSAKEALQSPWFESAKKKVETLSLENDADIVGALQRYSHYGKLKKIAWMVIAHHAEGVEIATLRSVFAALDKNNNAVITYSELKDYLKKFGVSSQDADKLFSSMDIDSSGEVNLVEFLGATIEAVCSIDRQRMGDAFDKIAKGEKYITAKHLEKIMGSRFRLQIREMIDVIDRNHDGRVNKREFLAMLEDKLEGAVEEELVTSDSLA